MSKSEKLFKLKFQYLKDMPNSPCQNATTIFSTKFTKGHSAQKVKSLRNQNREFLSQKKQERYYRDNQKQLKQRQYKKQLNISNFDKEYAHNNIYPLREKQRQKKFVPSFKTEESFDLQYRQYKKRPQTTQRQSKPKRSNKERIDISQRLQQSNDISLESQTLQLKSTYRPKTFSKQKNSYKHEQVTKQARQLVKQMSKVTNVFEKLIFYENEIKNEDMVLKDLFKNFQQNLIRYGTIISV